MIEIKVDKWKSVVDELRSFISDFAKKEDINVIVKETEYMHIPEIKLPTGTTKKHEARMPIYRGGVGMWNEEKNACEIRLNPRWFEWEKIERERYADNPGALKKIVDYHKIHRKQIVLHELGHCRHAKFEHGEDFFRKMYEQQMNFCTKNLSSFGNSLGMCLYLLVISQKIPKEVWAHEIVYEALGDKMHIEPIFEREKRSDFLDPNYYKRAKITAITKLEMCKRHPNLNNCDLVEKNVYPHFKHSHRLISHLFRKEHPKTKEDFIKFNEKWAEKTLPMMRANFNELKRIARLKYDKESS